MKQIIFLIGISILICSGCSKYSFESVSDQKYNQIIPCRLKVVVKFKEQTEDDYKLIGICEAKAPAGKIGNKNANNALKLLEKCACENGGELIKITDFQSETTVTTGAYAFWGYSSARNPNAPRKVSKDKLYAEIYIKKDK